MRVAEREPLFAFDHLDDHSISMYLQLNYPCHDFES